MAMAKLVSESAKKFKALRNRAGLSTRELGRLVGWGHTRVQYYEDEFKKAYLPQEVLKLFAPHLVGRGNPPITHAEVWALSGLLPALGVSDETVPDSEPEVATLLRHSDATISSDAEPNSPTLAFSRREELVRDLPFYETSVGEEGGTLMSRQSVRFVGRLERLVGREDVFSFKVATNEMEDRFEVGELIFCERAPAALTEYVLVELRGEEDGKRRVLLRRLVKSSHGSIDVEQLRPKRTTTIRRADIKEVWRVMRGNDLV